MYGGKGSLARENLRKKGDKPIENYGLIGNLSTVTLVEMDGCIDFMYVPRFESPANFAALLG